MVSILLKPVLSLVPTAEHESCQTDFPGCGVPAAVNQSVSSFSSKGLFAGGGFSGCDFQGPAIKD